MSNFYCMECGASILENEDGVYITGCEHFPVDKVKQFQLDSIYIEQFFSSPPNVQEKLWDLINDFDSNLINFQEEYNLSNETIASKLKNVLSHYLEEGE